MTKTNPHRTVTPATPAPMDKRRHLAMQSVPGKSADRMCADVVAQGLAGNANATLSYARAEFGELSITEMVVSLRDAGDAVNRGDLSESERMLNAQAVTLNSIFTNLAQRAHSAQTMPQMETYLRLALKAQSQCRATVETLSVIKNPPVVFARQMNVAHGPQQVNNGPGPNSTPASARTGETASAPTELLEDSNDGRTQLDTRATPAASRAHQGMAAVGEVNRAPHR